MLAFWVWWFALGGWVSGWFLLDVGWGWAWDFWGWWFYGTFRFVLFVRLCVGLWILFGVVVTYVLVFRFDCYVGFDLI